MRRVWVWGLAAAILLVMASQVVAACQAPATPAPGGQSAQATASGSADSRPVGQVLLVCNGSTKPCPAASRYRTVQAAVGAAKPGAWVLIWPGVYHENNPAHHAGVWITTPGLHIRGLNRGGVIIDGSNGTANHPCPSSPGLQDFTPRDGIVVWKASSVTIDNLTVCDYLAGPGAKHGTQIWWNGGDGSGKIGLGAYAGSYLTATSMYHPADIHNQHLAEFGIFAGNASGPGTITNSYASNMANAAFYVGACQRSCNTTLAYDHGTNSAAGYLGTNSGGQLIVKSSVFDRNRTGMVLLSLNTDDLPPPQDGRCQGSTDRSCTLIEGNRITDNNNADAPAFGIEPAVGVGVEIEGGSFDTVTGNLIEGNGAWGVLASDNIDLLNHRRGPDCQGGNLDTPAKDLCLFPARGNRISGNTFQLNGTSGNATNGDLATLSLGAGLPTPRNCFYSNHAIGGPLTSSPADIQAATVDGQPCGNPGTGNNPFVLRQIGCADGSRCTVPHAHYPRQAVIDSAAIPQLPTMPQPCATVPENGFC